MLFQRVVTALVLVALLLGSLALPGRWPFALITLAAMAVAGWEWGRLNQAGGAGAVAMGGAVAVAGAAALAAGWDMAPPSALWWAATLLWVAGGVVALRSGVLAWPRLPRSLRCALGLLALWSAWLALTQARAAGVNFMLSVLCLVWVADIGAYFGGRAFGRRKLAPSISPNKSWEGVWSGIAGVVLLALAWIWVDGRVGSDSASFYARLQESLGGAALLAALVGLCALSITGDLVESLVKRAAGAKDSSGLLPGHGGVLDRMDALLPVLPAAMALASTWAPT